MSGRQGFTGETTYSPVQGDRLAEGLGWFSIGLGLLEIMAPRDIAQGLGLGHKENLVRAYGAREIANGMAILATEGETRKALIWARLGGDVLDILTLAPGLSGRNPRRGAAMAAMAAVLGVTALDALCIQALGQQRRAEASRIRRLQRDYSQRSGFPRPAEAMRGAARDFEVPADMRIPEALRPYSVAV